MTQQDQQNILSILKEIKVDIGEIKADIGEVKAGLARIIVQNDARDKKIANLEETIRSQREKSTEIGDEVRALDSRHSELEISHVDRKSEAEHFTMDAPVATEEVKSREAIEVRDLGLKYFEFATSNAGLISEEIITGGTELTSPEETLGPLAPEAKIDIRALALEEVFAEPREDLSLIHI